MNMTSDVYKVEKNASESMCNQLKNNFSLFFAFTRRAHLYYCSLSQFYK